MGAGKNFVQGGGANGSGEKVRGLGLVGSGAHWNISPEVFPGRGTLCFAGC